MRILYVCADRGISLGAAKGAASHVRSITAALVARGHAVTAACGRLDGPNPAPPGVRVERLPLDPGSDAVALSALLDITGADVVLERYSLLSGSAQEAAERRGIPLVLEVNAPLVLEAARFRGLVGVRRRLALERHVLGAADHVMAVSEGVMAHVLACGAAPDRVSLVPNGVDAEQFENGDGRAVRRRLGLGDALVVGFCGSLKPWHGVLDLMTAAAGLPERVRLLIVGDGPEAPLLRAAVQRLGLAGRVVMTGAVPQADVPDHLAAMDVGVAPYASMDAFYFSPLKVLEYLAAGLPVVASDQGELRDLRDVAVLVPAGAPEQLGKAIRELLEDEPRRRRLGAAGRRVAGGRGWAQVAEQVERLLARRGAAA